MTVELEDVNDLACTATYLKITEDKVKRLARSGRLGATKQGRTWTFTRESIRDYVEENTTAPTVVRHPSGLTDRSLKRVRTGRI